MSEVVPESAPQLAGSSSAAPVAPAVDPTPSAPPALHVSDPHALLGTIARGLSSDATAQERTDASALWAMLQPILASAVPQGPIVAPPAAAPSAAPPPNGFPPIPNFPPAASPATAAVRALKQVPPDQLLDMAIQHLRSRLPSGAAFAAPQGIRFPLVPVTNPPR